MNCWHGWPFLALLFSSHTSILFLLTVLVKYFAFSLVCVRACVCGGGCVHVRVCVLMGLCTHISSLGLYITVLGGGQRTPQ